MMEKLPVIEVDGVSITHSGLRVIDSASFKLNHGDFVGVVGPNGGGKTTLIKAILGLLPRDSGTIKLFGEPVERFNTWRRIAYVGQDSINFDQSFPLSVRELVSLGRINRENIGHRLVVKTGGALRRYSLSWASRTSLRRGLANYPVVRNNESSWPKRW